MFQTLHNKIKCIVVWQWFTGISLLMLASQAVADQPRLRRVTLGPTPARMQSTRGNGFRLRLSTMKLGSVQIHTTQPFGSGFRTPASNTLTRRFGGGDFVIISSGRPNPVVVTTKLEIQVASVYPQQRGSKWGKSKSIRSPEQLNLRWTTGEASAVAGRWVLYETLHPSQRTRPIASGLLSPAPFGNHWAYFAVDLVQFLPDVVVQQSRYGMRVVPIGVHGQAVGPASSWVQIIQVPLPTNLAATGCEVKYGKVDWDEYKVACRVTNTGPYTYAGGRAFIIKRCVPGLPKSVWRTGVIPPGLNPGATYSRVFTSYYQQNPVNTYFEFILAPGDPNPGDDQCNSCD